MTDQSIQPYGHSGVLVVPDATIPTFEGEEVATTKAKLSSVAALEVGDGVFRMDETVRMVVECRVVGIDHKVSADGKLERVHHLKAVDSLVIGWAVDIDDLRKPS